MQNNFSISNTDLVTMLMVKQKELLSKRVVELSAISAGCKLQVYNRIKKKLDVKFKELKPLLDKYEELIKLYNPKVNFKLDVYEPTKENLSLTKENLSLITEENIDYFYLKLDYICFEVDVDEKHEDKYVSIEPDGGFFVPFKFSFKEKADKAYMDAINELHYTQNLLYNESKLRDTIVAKMTETALQNMPELKLLSENALTNINLLEG
jgi:hypothetical protein